MLQPKTREQIKAQRDSIRQALLTKKTLNIEANQKEHAETVIRYQQQQEAMNADIIAKYGSIEAFQKYNKKLARMKDVPLDGIGTMGKSEEKGSCSPGVNEKKTAASSGVNYAYGTGVEGVKVKRKKYVNGTGTVGTGQVVNPNQTLSEFQLLMDNAKIEGESNIWANTIIPMATSVLTSAASAYGGKPAETTTAALGSNNMTGQVEVEGDEVIEEPNSAPVQVKGPSHENGGVDVDVAPGTKIYSDRIKLGGKTMAERKKARENLLLDLDKKSSTRQGDEATKNSINRMKSNIEKEEQSDLQLQELANNFQSMKKQFALGTGQKGVQEYGDGTGPYGVQTQEEYLTSLRGAQGEYEQNFEVPSFLNNFSGRKQTASVNQITPVGTTYDQALATEAQAYFTPRVDNSISSVSTEEAASNPSTGYVPTAGDMTSLFGNLISAFGPMANTKANRAGDTPNINAYENFGKDALKTNEETLGLVKSQAANSATNLRRSAVATKRAARNSSRSVNTQRATDTLIDLEANNQELTVDDNLSKQMMQILGNKSNLQNTKDRIVMEGEQLRDENDRKDRDAFYTQLAQDTATKGQGIQQTGKDLNAMSENQMYMKMLNQMSKYFQFDSKGNIIGINQTKK